jgi:integrase/recombinase XerC
MYTAGGFSALLRGFCLALTVEGLRPHTIHSYVRDVERFTEWADGRSPRSISPNDIRGYIVTLQNDRAPKTVREAQLALRRFFRFVVREGEIDRDPTTDMKLANFRVEPQPTYSEPEVKRLLLACDNRTPSGIRDKALILTLFDTGVREGELVSMGLPQWERRIVRVDGKTGVRDVPLGTATLQAVERYVRRWGIAEPPLWRGKKGALTGSGVLQIVRRLCHRAAAAQMNRLGMNDSDILEVCGWRSIEMLRRYTAEVADELAQAAHRRFSPGDALRVR